MIASYDLCVSPKQTDADILNFSCINGFPFGNDIARLGQRHCKGCFWDRVGEV